MIVDYVNQQPLELKCKRFKTQLRRRRFSKKGRELRAHVMSNMKNAGPYGNEPLTPIFNVGYSSGSGGVFSE